MGVMHFLVPRREHVGADAAERAYFAGIDEVPWLTRVQWNDRGLVVERASSTPATSSFPTPSKGMAS